jgi:hypothetical protein
LVPHLERDNELTAGHVNFRDQSINANIIKNFSYDICTIDLSAASDRISLKHLRMFENCWFYPLLRRCRASFTTFDPKMGLDVGELHQLVEDGFLQALSQDSTDEVTYMRKLSKAFSMGNSLTFPIEALIFYATCVCAVSDATGLDNNLVKDYIYVYGDDIICPREWYHYLEESLQQFGFKVNTEKSYFRGGFRESCGAYVYNDCDITPIRLKSLPRYTRGKSPKISMTASVIGFTDFIHNLYEVGLLTCASHAARYVPDLPVGSKDAPILTRPPVLEHADFRNSVLEGTGLYWVNRNQPLSYSLKEQCFYVTGFSVTNNHVHFVWPKIDVEYLTLVYKLVVNSKCILQIYCLVLAAVAYLWLLGDKVLAVEKLQRDNGLTESVRYQLYQWDNFKKKQGYHDPVDSFIPKNSITRLRRCKVPLQALSCAGAAWRP